MHNNTKICAVSFLFLVLSRYRAISENRLLSDIKSTLLNVNLSSFKKNGDVWLRVDTGLYLPGNRIYLQSRKFRAHVISQ